MAVNVRKLATLDLHFLGPGLIVTEFALCVPLGATFKPNVFAAGVGFGILAGFIEARCSANVLKN